MGMTLLGSKSDFSMDLSTWSAVLLLAYRNGWAPVGTEPPEFNQGGEIPMSDRAKWDGSYTGNDGQYVTVKDTQNLAAALENALRDIPDRAPMAQGQERLEVCNHSASDELDDLFEEDLDMQPSLGEGEEAGLRDFVAFCQEAGFRIW